MTVRSEPSTFTPEHKNQFCLVISIGCDRETAGKYVGCTVQQFHEALLQDAQFARQLARAEATAELAHMRNIHNAAKDEKQWRVSVWWLERALPHRYARRTPEAVSADQLEEIIKDLADAIAAEVASELDRRRLLARLAKIAGRIQNDRAAETRIGSHDADGGTDDP